MLSIAIPPRTPAEVPQVIDLRFPGEGITEILADWTNNHGGWPAFAGDVDGDGFDDFLVMHIVKDPVEPNSSPYIILVYGGPRESFGPQVDLETVRQTHFLKSADFMDGFYPQKGFGGAGDVDGDGFDDIVMSAPAMSWNGVRDNGHVLLIFGSPRYPPDVGLDDPGSSGVRFLRIFSMTPERFLGFNVRNAGDLNGDGKSDLAISAESPGIDNGTPSGAGRVYVLHGGFDPSQDIDIEEVGRSVPGFILHGSLGDIRPSYSVIGDWLGFSARNIVPAGDLNGDGFDDLLAGAHYASRSLPRAGAIYVVYGGLDHPGDLFISRPEDFGVEFQGVSSHGFLGSSIAGVGDVDGDGLGDFIAGNNYEYGSPGEAFLIYGARDWPARARVDDLAIRSFRLRGTFPDFPYPRGGSLGNAAAGIGDWNADGFDDFLVSEYRQPVGFKTKVGKVYLILGGPHLPREAFDYQVSGPGLPGTVILGKDSYVHLGNQAESGGDFDGDGHGDFILMAPFLNAPRGALDKSSIYIFYGGAAPEPLALLAVEPGEGSIEGGLEATLRGRGFRGGESVFFGGVEALGVEVISSAEIRAVAPPSENPGPAAVEVRGEAGATARLDPGFTYHAPPEHPDLLLDPGWLRGRGFRTLDYRDFTKRITVFSGSARWIGFVGVFSGDLDADGLDDLVVYGSEEGIARNGRISILFGEEGPPATIDAGETGDHGVTIQAEDDVVAFAFSAAFPGDLDGDNYPDLALGALDRFSILAGEEGGDGRTYILFGRPRWERALMMDREVAEGRALRIINTSCSEPRVAAPGDLDGDGFPDLAIGHEGCSGAIAKVSLYLDGMRPAGAVPFPGAAVRGDPTLVGPPPPITGTFEPKRFGSSLAVAGDMNGDGVDDLLVGAEHATFGECFIVLGGGFGVQEEAPVNDLIATGRAVRVRSGINMSLFGRVVAPAGDFNGDGLADALFGAMADGRDWEGAVYILFGSRELGSGIEEIDLQEEGPGHLRIPGEFSYDWMGVGSGIGDWNRDGFGDIAILSSGHRNQLARAYVIFGEENPPPVIDLGKLGRRGFRITGVEGSWFSAGDPGAIAGGDFDGDGLRDLAIGEQTPEEMRVMVIFGKGEGEARFVRGEVTGDGAIDISDPVRILGYLFLGEGEPRCLDAADVNDDGAVDLADAVYLLGHLFLGEAAPPAPYPGRGEDPTPDPLGCR